MGLDSALKWYLDGFAERSKIATKLEVSADHERLSQDYELCLFRIAQECLTNIHRHSGSSIAVVRLLRSPEEIKLEVSDDGKGINPETQSKIASGETVGVGLRGMRERLNSWAAGCKSARMKREPRSLPRCPWKARLAPRFDRLWTGYELRTAMNRPRVRPLAPAVKSSNANEPYIAGFESVVATFR